MSFPIGLSGEKQGWLAGQGRRPDLRPPLFLPQARKPLRALAAARAAGRRPRASALCTVRRWVHWAPPHPQLSGVVVRQPRGNIPKIPKPGERGNSPTPPPSVSRAHPPVLRPPPILHSPPRGLFAKPPAAFPRAVTSPSRHNPARSPPRQPAPLRAPRPTGPRRAPSPPPPRPWRTHVAHSPPTSCLRALETLPGGSPRPLGSVRSEESGWGEAETGWEGVGRSVRSEKSGWGEVAMGRERSI